MEVEDEEEKKENGKLGWSSSNVRSERGVLTF